MKNTTTTTNRTPKTAEELRDLATAYLDRLTAYRNGRAKTEPTATDEVIEGIYNLADFVVTHTISVHNAKAPHPIYTELMASYYNDKRVRNAYRTAIIEDEHRRRADKHRANRDNARHLANLISTDETDRLKLWEWAEDEHREFTAEGEDIKSIKTLDGITSTERENLVNSVIECIYQCTVTPPTPTADKLASYGITDPKTADKKTLKECQASATFAEYFRTAHRALRALQSVKALGSTWTKSTKATAEDVTEWRNRYGNTETKVPTKSGYIALEYKQATKTKAEGFYIVTHGQTVRRMASIEEMRTEGNEPSTENTARPRTTAQDLNAIYRACANLTDRERAILKAFCTPTARAEGKKAVERYRRTAGKKWSYGRINSARYEGQRAHAVEQIATEYGLTTATACKVWSRAVAKMTATAPQYDRITTTADLVHLMQSKPHNTRPTESHRADLIQWAEHHTAEHTAVIEWQTAEQMTARAERRAKATAEDRAKADRRATEYGAFILTAEYIARAEESHRRAVEKYTAEQTARATAQALHNIPQHLQTLNTTFTQWQQWSADERRQHAEYLDLISK